MATTHMGYGFLMAYLLIFLVEKTLSPSSLAASWSVCFVLAGLFGGGAPDIDRCLRCGFSHRKTFHYPMLSGLLAVAFGLFWSCSCPSVLAAVASCFFAGAWLHSFMDIFDGPWADDEGVYEHLRDSWIRALNWVHFASLAEWVLLTISAVLVIVVSPRLPRLAWFPGWGAAAVYLLIVAGTLAYEIPKEVPRRSEMERRLRNRSAS
jgi:hypothetical protein